MSTLRTSPREDGFTLVELLVATTMALIVFAVTLSTLAVFSNSTQTLNQQNDSQNQARLILDQIVSQLRNVASASTPATFVERATPDDLVFQTISVDAGVSTVERVRYCVPTGAGTAAEPLIMQTTTVTGAIPWAANVCPDTSGGATSSVLVSRVTNALQAGDPPIFTYDNATGPVDLSPTPPDDSSVYASIKSIGIDLFVNPEPGKSYTGYDLRSSALLRNAQSLPRAAFTWSQGTTDSVNLDAGTSYSPSGDALSYSWSCSPVTCSSTASMFTLTNPGPLSVNETVTLSVTDQAGLRSPPFTSTLQIP